MICGIRTIRGRARPGGRWTGAPGCAGVCRVVGTAAAIALALGAWSQLSTGAGTPAEGPGGDTVLQQSEEAPVELPTAATSVPPELASPSPSVPGVRAG